MQVVPDDTALNILPLVILLSWVKWSLVIQVLLGKLVPNVVLLLNLTFSILFKLFINFGFIVHH